MFDIKDLDKSVLKRLFEESKYISNKEVSGLIKLLLDGKPLPINISDKNKYILHQFINLTKQRVQEANLERKEQYIKIKEEQKAKREDIKAAFKAEIKTENKAEVKPVEDTSKHIENVNSINTDEIHTEENTEIDSSTIDNNNITISKKKKTTNS